MTYDLLYGLILFAFASSITPGPNNLMLMASGANFGFRRSIPHMLGIGFGFMFMLAMVGAGLIRIFDLWPRAYDVMRVLSLGYLLWLAWKTATASGFGDSAASGSPLTFLQAAIFQWVNPKAWAMALTAMSVYAPDRSLFAVACVAALFGAVNLPSVSTWTLMGQQVARFLTNPKRRVVFNYVMAGILLASSLPVVFT
ncbi:MAG: LysE family translocator [Paracoccaceae bacterium]